MKCRGSLQGWKSYILSYLLFLYCCFLHLSSKLMLLIPVWKFGGIWVPMRWGSSPCSPCVGCADVMKVSFSYWCKSQMCFFVKCRICLKINCQHLWEASPSVQSKQKWVSSDHTTHSLYYKKNICFISYFGSLTITINNCGTFLCTLFNVLLFLSSTEIVLIF